MSMSTAVKYLKLTYHIQKTNLLSAMEYRASFLLQVFGMIINNAGLLCVWLIFFKKFPVINGWGIQEMLLLYGANTFIFSLVWLFFFGTLYISDYIIKGQLDNYLVQPKNILWNVSISKMDISAVGDMVFGLLIFGLSQYFNLFNSLIFIIVGLIGALIFYSVIVIIQSITFYFGNFEAVAEEFVNALLGFTLYPQSVYHGALKIAMFTIIPAAFIGLIPFQILAEFSFLKLLLMVIVAVVTFTLANIVFNRGLKRYESGNLINLKM